MVVVLHAYMFIEWNKERMRRTGIKGIQLDIKPSIVLILAIRKEKHSVTARIKLVLLGNSSPLWGTKTNYI